MSTAVTALSPVAPPAAAGWEPFRLLLEDLRVDCIRERELALAESATSIPDQVAVSRAARLLRTVEEIDAGIARIADGTYGACVRCGVDIPTERLEVRPFAAGCVGCDGRSS